MAEAAKLDPANEEYATLLSEWRAEKNILHRMEAKKAAEAEARRKAKTRRKAAKPKPAPVKKEAPGEVQPIFAE